MKSIEILPLGKLASQPIRQNGKTRKKEKNRNGSKWKQNTNKSNISLVE